MAMLNNQRVRFFHIQAIFYCPVDLRSVTQFNTALSDGLGLSTQGLRLDAMCIVLLRLHLGRSLALAALAFER
jgi:hypothetical protein